MKKRQCTHCRFLLPVKEFSKNRSGPGGYTFWCKICHKDHLAMQRAKQRRIRDGEQMGSASTS